MSSATHTSSIQKASTHNTTILNVSIALLLAYSVHICNLVYSKQYSIPNIAYSLCTNKWRELLFISVTD